MSDEIPDFLPTFGESEVRLESWCPHADLMLHVSMRTVTCRMCRRAVDPFDALLKQARKERYVEDTGARLKELHAQLAELHAEEERHHRAAYKAQEVKKLAESILRNLQTPPEDSDA